jgi:3D (Asp-Asp-Asp) domain-containing protein
MKPDLKVVVVIIICLVFTFGIVFKLIDFYEHTFDQLETTTKQTELENKILANSLMNKTLQKEVNYMRGTATAYTPSAGGINADSDPTKTATMTKPENGVIAVNPEVIPYYSEVMIIHGNTVIRGRALDTGGAMRQNPTQVDILMEDHEKAKKWGRKEVHIIWW